MKKLLVNTLAVLSIAVGLVSYSSTANADIRQLTLPGSSCTTTPSIATECVFSNDGDLILSWMIAYGTGPNAVSVTAKQSCWRAGIKWGVLVSGRWINFWDGGASSWTHLGQYSMQYVSPAERSRVFYFGNLPLADVGKERARIRVIINNATKNCIESVGLTISDHL